MNRNHEQLISILKLRMAVGLLGEKEHGNWWPSLWGTSNATAFLSPIYGVRTNAARYHGVTEAARRVHDSRIGVGRAFHLFRLPENLERRLHDAIVKDGALTDFSIDTQEGAQAVLADIAVEADVAAGPIRVGSIKELENGAWLRAVAGHYLSAFQGSQQTFPYFAEGL